MPRPPVYNSRVVKIDAATDGTEQRLPLEGKLAQRQLRLMRSKPPIITIGWYDAVTFDLIRHAVGVPLRNGMTATGSHEYFYSLRGAQPPGEGFSLSRSSQRRFLLLKYGKIAGEACPAATGIQQGSCE